MNFQRRSANTLAREHMKPPLKKFPAGTLIKGIWHASDYVQYPLLGIVLNESPLSNWYGSTYTRWYYILIENGKIVEELEKCIDVA